MIKTFTRLLALIALATATLSCSKAFINGEDAVLDGDLTIVVSGVASDVATNTPLTGIKVTFAAYHSENSLSVLPLATKTVYTDSNGVYAVEVTGFSENVTCTLTAESTDQNETRYETMTNKIIVSWNGNSFDKIKGRFVVNNCNFQMKETR
jgi:hypothetical protein